MADVAAEAGVSITTVSHYVNNTRPVAPETGAAIESAISRTGYVINAVARSLARSSTGTIGLAVPIVANPYLSELISSVESILLESGYSLLLADTGADGQQEKRVVSMLHEHRIDGLLLASALDLSGLQSMLRSLSDLPAVLLDQIEEGVTWADQVGVNNATAAARLVEHLVTVHGHTRIAHMTGSSLATARERLQGHRDGLAAFGLPFDPDLVLSGASSGAERAVVKLLDSEHPPTAIVTGTSYVAFSVLRSLNRLGYAVPDDVAVATFDEVEWGELLPAPLTMVSQPYPDIARKAINLLLSRIQNPETGSRREIARFDTSIIYRRSCGCTPEETQ